ncbi:monovalent cation/H+ antiporter subunit D [Sphingomonas turrisvirgatae]|uniref:Monovalent cation/H+ antiporter subunit D n=1 Tax=Sphingomonas turrisvirgatae TaxID=1888892 RepID=A0A1E3LU70_9SPHN|nr:monovalent cation/H+ antiporter subunit D [Sphingomonas turrisvirgatae]ODP37274.1 monovalent cation/H+ antiporter subunit D [Sphingomonas turrisvirgatae]
MTPWIDHLIVAPILLPLIAGAAILLLKDRRHLVRRGIAIGTAATLLVVAGLLVARVADAGFSGQPGTTAYQLGSWPAPFGIVLVLDWLSALMLMLTSILGLTSLIYATARWDRAGPRFHSLFLFQLMGLNGAFLTGDLFNLFVFFEVLLAASFALLLHGSGKARIKAALHYISINVATSLLFLIGAATIYGVTGTLNMADLAVRIPAIGGSDLAILQSGMAILGMAFLVKAGMWPLGFWLPRTYAAASPPVAALFAMLSKVGVYAVLRVYLLLLNGEVGWSANFGEEWLLFGGMATIAFGTVGVLAVRTLSRIAGYSLVISAGTLLAAVGAGQGAVLAGALFYLVSSTLAVGAFYLLIELVDRREASSDAAGAPVFDDEFSGLPDQVETEVRVAIPATMAILGSGFAFCALLIAGLPPLSGFIAKFVMIDGLLSLGETVAPTSWLLIGLIIGSGLATLVATTRAGIDLIWAPSDKPQPALRVAEAAPVALLLVICMGLMVLAAPTMRYMERTSQSLGDRQGYGRAVLGNPARPQPDTGR